MRKIIMLSVGVLSIMLFAFTSQKKITLRADGNYYVPADLAKQISEKDAKRLFQLTKSLAASETTVVHTTIWTTTNNRMKVSGKVRTAESAAAETTVVHETIYKHKDAKVSRDAARHQAEIRKIMTKYTR